jgi:hypothetical protein
MSTAGMHDHRDGGEDHRADHRGADDHGAEDGGDLLLMASRTRTGWTRRGSEAVARCVCQWRAGLAAHARPAG